MLVMVEKGIIDGVCLAICQYIKANNKYINDYDKNKGSSYLKHWGINNLYRPAMSPNFLPHGFKWVKTNKSV